MKKYLLFILSFILVCSFSIMPVFAAELPYSVEPPHTEYEEYIIYRNSKLDSLRAYVFNKNNLKDYDDKNISLYSDGHYSLAVHTKSSACSWTIYYYDSVSSSWKTIGTESGGYFWVYVSGPEDIYYCPFNIYYDDTGEPFFPLPQIPMAEQILGIVKQEIPQMNQGVLGVMNTLALCGVGCLASLIILKVFGKVFSRFHL